MGPNDEPQKICFVVQGFGEKTDYRTGRKLNLDASYDVIKEAVEAAGLKCIRADEIQHSQIIDKPMYEYILTADLVIADLSTSNVNAAYELGVRHALRRRPTVIVAEKQWDFPFDINRNLIRTYEHLGPDLGRQEARRFSEQLTEAIQAILDDPDAVDSPLYTFLPDLSPPAKEDRKETLTNLMFSSEVPEEPSSGDIQSVKALTDRAKGALKESNFSLAKSLLEAAHQIRPNDEYIIQQLALATYKSKQPTEKEALVEAHKLIVEKLDPSHSNDPETIGLWASVHKRLWGLTEDPVYLRESIDALERGFRLKNDYYNGINLAFLLNLRGSLSEDDPAGAVADFVLAKRVRQKVTEVCRQALEQGIEQAERKYWVLATLWEAAAGLEDATRAAHWEAEARRHVESEGLAGWMVESTTSQISKLQEIMSPTPLRFVESAS